MPITFKNYRCKACGFEKKIDTNHYGECYSLGNYNRCPKCGPLPPDPKCPAAVIYPTTTWVCVDPVPEGVKVPEPWRHAKLGDLVEIVEGDHA
jgi:hypothetical protein